MGSGLHYFQKYNFFGTFVHAFVINYEYGGDVRVILLNIGIYI